MGYSLKQLKLQRDELNNSVLAQLHADNLQIKLLADAMAEAATNVQGQGYAAFVNARETFLTEVDRIGKEYALFVCSDTCSRLNCTK